MNRKQAICYLIIGLILFLGLLIFMALFSIWLMLLVLLAAIVIFGLLRQNRPELFAIFQKAPKNICSFGPQNASWPPPKPYTPSMILVNLSTTNGEQIIINKPVFTLGRDRSCDHVLSNCSEISRTHVTIRYDEQKQESFIVDNNSHNGTYVNNIRLRPETPKTLVSGDLVQLGTLRFMAQSAHY